ASVIAPPPTPPLFPYTTLFRSQCHALLGGERELPQQLLDHACAPARLPLAQSHGEPAGEVPRGGRRVGRQPRLRQQHGHLARLRSEEHTSELQSRENLVCRLLL